ncbi:MAG: AbrB/MazE/SpoVT family DNA-binding domain-containing protein [Chloroflexota bacterium]
MEKATLFKNGGSQAVRLPRKFRFEGTEVYIRKVPEGILLMPKEEYADLIWQEWLENLNKYDEIIEIDRGGDPQVREGLDELFP